MGLTEPSTTRVFGMADLALVPGLLGRSPGPWLAARVVLNLAIIRHLLNLAPNAQNAHLPRMVSAAIAVASAGDLRVIAAVKRTDPTSHNEAG